VRDVWEEWMSNPLPNGWVRVERTCPECGKDNSKTVPRSHAGPDFTTPDAWCYACNRRAAEARIEDSRIKDLARRYAAEREDHATQVFERVYEKRLRGEGEG